MQQKCWKWLFRPAFGVRSIQTLVEIYNTHLILHWQKTLVVLHGANFCILFILFINHHLLKKSIIHSTIFYYFFLMLLKTFWFLDCFLLRQKIDNSTWLFFDSPLNGNIQVLLDLNLFNSGLILNEIICLAGILLNLVTKQQNLE